MLASEMIPADSEILNACFPIASLEGPQRAHVIESCTVLEVDVGTVIIRQGERGDAFFIVLGGEVEVLIREPNGHDLRVAELGPGDYFGEKGLLGPSCGKRAATVRATTRCRYGAIPAGVFQGVIAKSVRNIDEFERNASGYIYDQVSKSLQSFAAHQLDTASEGVKQVTFATGDTVIREGDSSDAAFLILSGVCLVLRQRGASSRELARLGAGQVVGELGVLRDQPRAATVVAETPLELLRIEPEPFRQWHSTHPNLGHFFDTVAGVYAIPGKRDLSVFRGALNGESAITTVRGRPTDGVVSTRILERGVVAFSNGGADTRAGDLDTLTFANDRIKRELRVVVLERNQDRIERCIVYGVAAEGIDSDLGELYSRVANLDEVSGLELRRFKRTGFLGGTSAAARGQSLCPCLGVKAAQVDRVVDELDTADFIEVRTAMGAGMLCGGCEPAVRAHLESLKIGRKSQAPQLHSNNLVADTAPPPGEATCPVSHARALKDSRYPLDRIRRLLSSWDSTGDGRVRRTEVAVHFRGMGVRDVDALLDTLFPDALPPEQSVSITSLLETLTRVTDFDPPRIENGPDFSTRQNSAAGKPKSMRRFVGLVRTVLRHRKASLGIGGLSAASVCIGLLWAAYQFGSTSGLAVATIALLVSIAWLSNNPGVRLLWYVMLRGEDRLYSAIFSAFGSATKYVVLKPLGPFGPRLFFLRDEDMVEQVLNRPLRYVRDSRAPLDDYLPFNVGSVLWGGVDGYWLGYRSVCEDYFVEGYQADIPEMTDIVRQRVTTWIERGEINLLDEMYRIVLEIRARVFFQSTFDCFDDNAHLDFAALVDRVLSGRLFFFVADADAEFLHGRVMKAVRGASRPGSVGHLLRRCLENGDLEEREVLHNAVMYVLAQAPTMAVFWTIYRAARTGTASELRGNRQAIVRAIKEEMRLHPPVTSMFWRVATRDDMIEGVRIPKGSQVIVSPLWVHTSKANWLSPFSFDANRWTSSTGDALEIVEPKTNPEDEGGRPSRRAEGCPANRYLPFGSGAHKCQGRFFASDEMLVIIDTILQSVKLEVIEDDGLLDRSLPEQIRFSVYSRPANEVKLRISRLD